MKLGSFELFGQAIATPITISEVLRDRDQLSLTLTTMAAQVITLTIDAQAMVPAVVQLVKEQLDLEPTADVQLLTLDGSVVSSAAEIGSLDTSVRSVSAAPVMKNVASLPLVRCG